MSKIGFQFHASVEETSKFICDMVIENKLKAAIVHTHPVFKYIIVDSRNINLDMILKAQEILLFFLEPNEDGANNYLEFLRANEGCLSIRFGFQNESILKESIIGGIADNDLAKFWKKIIGQYKKTMYKGAWVLDEYSGVKRYYKEHRYTQGVKVMYDNGVIISPLAGNCRYILGTPH